MKGFLTIIVLFVLTSTCTGQIPCTNATDACGEGTCINNYCACFSQWEGITTCDTTFSGNCTPWQPEELVTGNNTYINYALTTGFRFAGDPLHVVLENPFVNNRTTTIALANGTASCEHPGPYWSKTIVDAPTCVDRFTSDIPYSIFEECILSSEDAGNFFVQNARIDVTHDDFLADWADRGLPDVTRITINRFYVYVYWPKFITLNSTITILSGTKLQGAIIQQEIEVTPNRTGIIDIYTSLPFPYKFNPNCVPYINTTRTDLGITITLVNQSTYTCPDTGNSNQGDEPPCGQVYQVEFSMGSACNISGDYEINFPDCEECREDLGNASSCTLTNTTDSLLFSLVSENICATTIITVPLTGNLQSFNNPAHSGPQATQFFPGQIVYFLVNAQSQRQIQSVEVIGVTLEILGDPASAQTIRVLVNGVPTNIPCGTPPSNCGAALSDPATESSNGNTVAFTLTIDTADLFKLLSPTSDFSINGSPKNFLITITILATLADGNKREATFQTSLEEAAEGSGVYTSQFVLIDDGSYIQPSSASLSLAVSYLFAIFFSFWPPYCYCFNFNNCNE